MPNPKLLTAREYQSKKNTLKGTAGGPDPTGTRSNKKHGRNKNPAQQTYPAQIRSTFCSRAAARRNPHRRSQSPSRFDPRLPPPPPGCALDRVVRRCAWWRWWWWWWSAVCFFKWCHPALRAPMGGPGRGQPKKRRPRRSSEPYMPSPHSGSGLSKSRGRVPI